jgi:hypothetical protein
MRLALIAAFLGGCSSDGTSTLSLTVDATTTVAAIDHLTLQFTDEARSRTSLPVTVALAGASIPPAQSLSLQFPASVRGAVHVEAEADDATGKKLIAGGTDVAITPGQVASATVTLGVESGGGDGGADFASPPPDLTPRPITFAMPAMITAPSSRALASADFNGDHKLDLVSVDNTAAGTVTLSLLLGNGDGTFQSPRGVIGHSTAMAYGVAVAAADLDHDTNTDLVITSGDGNEVSFLRGNGDGTFMTPTNYSSTQTGVGCSLGALALADVTSDGKPDAVVLSNCLAGVVVYPGIGSGAVVTPNEVKFTTAATLQDLAVTDLNHDGANDLVVVDQDRIDIVLSTGGATFGNSVPVTATGILGSRILVADANRDGVADLFYVNQNKMTLGVFLGNGNGTFKAEADFATGGQPFGFVLDDFDADNAIDAIVGLPNQSKVMALSGVGDGTFKPPLDLGFTGQWLGPMLSADFNGDGKPDLVNAMPFFIALNAS